MLADCIRSRSPCQYVSVSAVEDEDQEVADRYCWEPPVTPHRPQPRLVVSDPDVTSGQRFPLLCVLPIIGMDAIEEGLAPLQ